MNQPNDETIRNVVRMAKTTLSPADAQKIERLAQDKNAVANLTANLTDKDWAMVNQVMNNPVLLRQILTSSKGKEVLQKFLNGR